MECIDGTLACHTGVKARVTIKIDKQVINATFPGKVCVKKEDSGEPFVGSEFKCFRFWATGDGQITFQHYACGKTASYRTDPSLYGNGAWLIVDGEIQNSSNYFYWSGFVEGYQCARFLAEVDRRYEGGQISGSCDTCKGNGCFISVTTENGINYKSPRGAKCEFEIACGDECPQGYIRCETPGYPGYCCIPCSEIKGEIIAIKNTVKSLNNG